MYACADVNKRIYARTNTRDAYVRLNGKSVEPRKARAVHAALRFRARKKHADVKELAPHKGNDMCRSIDQSNRSNGGPSASGPLPPLDF